MTRESCIAHRPKQPIVILREDYRALTGDRVSAVLLNEYEYRANKLIEKYEDADVYPLGEIGIKDLEQALLGESSDKQIRLRNKYLEDQGFISTTKEMGKPTQYFFHISFTQQALDTPSQLTEVYKAWSTNRGQLTEVNQPRSTNRGQMTEVPGSNNQGRVGQITEAPGSNNRGGVGQITGVPRSFDRYSIYRRSEKEERKLEKKERRSDLNASFSSNRLDVQSQDSLVSDVSRHPESPVDLDPSGKGQCCGVAVENVGLLPWQRLTETYEIMTDSGLLQQHLGEYFTSHGHNPLLLKGNLKQLFAAGLIELWSGPDAWDWREGAIVIAKQRLIANTKNESPSVDDAKRYINNRIDSAVFKGDWSDVKAILQDAIAWETRRVESAAAVNIRTPISPPAHASSPSHTPFSQLPAEEQEAFSNQMKILKSRTSNGCRALPVPTAVPLLAPQQDGDATPNRLEQIMSLADGPVRDRELQTYYQQQADGGGAEAIASVSQGSKTSLQPLMSALNDDIYAQAGF